MAVDAHKNLAYSTVLTAPSPASSGTSLVVQSADGAKFPAVSFNATIWPVGLQPTTTNSEIVRVTAISTDTFTITRAQESTSARSVIVGDQIAATVTAKTLTDIENYINGTSAPTITTPVIRNFDGWLDANETWTFASASTFTVAGVDVTAKYPAGTLLKYTQTTVKYAVVASSSFSTNTTVTIIVNTDYTIANAAISVNYYSYDDNPQGFPASFTYTTTVAGFSANPASILSRYTTKGRTCIVWIYCPNLGTSNATTYTYTAPVTSATISNQHWLGMGAGSADGASKLAAPGVADIGSNTTTITMWVDGTLTNAWTGSSTKRISVAALEYDF